MTKNQTPDPRVVLAETALNNLYQSWELHGGPSPSTDDEAREIAHVLGVDPITDEAVINSLWEVGQDGSEPAVIAAAHVAALDAREEG